MTDHERRVDRLINKVKKVFVKPETAIVRSQRGTEPAPGLTQLHYGKGAIEVQS